MIVLDIILWLFIALLGLLLLLIVMPLSVRAEGEVDSDTDSLWFALKVTWGLGLLAMQFSNDGGVVRICGIPVWRRALGDLASDDGTSRKKKKRKKKKKDKKKDRGKGFFERLAWVREHWAHIKHMVFAYLRALHPYGRVEGVVGLPDPSQTAWVHRVLVGLDAVLPDGTMQVRVDWVEELVWLRTRLGGWVWPPQLIGITLLFLLDRRTWRVLRSA